MNPNVHYPIHESQSLVTILSPALKHDISLHDGVIISFIYFNSCLMSSFHLRLQILSGLFPSGSEVKFSLKFSSSHNCYMPLHYVVLDVNTLVIFDEA